RNGELARYDQTSATWASVAAPEGIGAPLVMAAGPVSGSTSGVWVGTQSGLFRCDLKTLQWAREESTIPQKAVKRLALGGDSVAIAVSGDGSDASSVFVKQSDKWKLRVGNSS